MVSYVYVLMSDGDGTMCSSDKPFGICVTTEEEAKRFVEEGRCGYTHSYQKLAIFVNKDDAIKHIYPQHKTDEQIRKEHREEQ